MLHAGELLGVWEAGLAADESTRALLLHAVARPADPVERLLATPVGTRDAELLALRCRLFGERMSLRVTCAGCAMELATTVRVGELLAAFPTAVAAVLGPADPGDRRDTDRQEADGRRNEDDRRSTDGRHDTGDRQGADPAKRQATDPAGGETGGPAPAELRDGEWTVRFRPPTVGDLRAAAAAGPDRAREVLLGRCLLAVTRAGRPVDPGELPEHVQARVAEECAAADPGADLRLDVPCPDCGHRTKALFDIAAALWAELDAWARGTLLDVHLLATAYGWTEPEVLALSPLRRRRYLEMVGHV